jgi:voltage-gated potassium channel
LASRKGKIRREQNMIPKPSQTDAEKRLNPLEIITLIFSIYVLIALLIQSLVPLSPDAVALLDWIDLLVCIVFLTDFFVRFKQAPSKLAFLKWGWIDFVSSIPAFDMFRVGRVVRIIRVFRVLRAFRSTKILLVYLLRERKTTSLAAVTATSLVVVIFAAIAALQFETSPDSNIKTAGEALWWAIVTVTTVGYGDKFPVTPEGRIVACVLMAVGVGLFGAFTGFIASLFVEPQLQQDETAHERVLQEIRTLDSKITSLEAKLDELKILR